MSNGLSIGERDQSAERRGESRSGGSSALNRRLPTGLGKFEKLPFSLLLYLIDNSAVGSLLTSVGRSATVPGRATPVMKRDCVSSLDLSFVRRGSSIARCLTH